jgi:uncharacterized membrane protein
MSLPNLLIILGVLIVVGLSIHFVHEHWESESRQQYGDVAGFIFGAIAVMYSVLLAFVAVAGWESLSSARQTTQTEANELATIYWISRSLPSPPGTAIEGLTVRYAETVTDIEWPLMGEGKTSPVADVLLRQIRADLFGFKPQTDQQQVLYQQAVSSMQELSGARRDRVDMITEQLPEPLWVALIIGGVLAVGFCLVFGVESKKAHIAMVLGYAAVVTILLLLIKGMQYPFGGNPHVGPSAFEIFLSLVHQKP